MIAVDQSTLEAYPDRAAELKARMSAIEQMIRKGTNNNFQRREKRFFARVTGGALSGAPPFFAVGDTVEATDAGAYDGLYTVAALEDGEMTLAPALPDGTAVTVTKIEYPADVLTGANDLLRWDLEYRGKAGVKSESLARHSVTYLDLDATNSRHGYPAALVGFMARYRKARF